MRALSISSPEVISASSNACLLAMLSASSTRSRSSRAESSVRSCAIRAVQRPGPRQSPRASSPPRPGRVRRSWRRADPARTEHESARSSANATKRARGSAPSGGLERRDQRLIMLAVKTAELAQAEAEKRRAEIAAAPGYGDGPHLSGAHARFPRGSSGSGRSTRSISPSGRRSRRRKSPPAKRSNGRGSRPKEDWRRRACRAMERFAGSKSNATGPSNSRRFRAR